MDIPKQSRRLTYTKYVTCILKGKWHLFPMESFCIHPQRRDPWDQFLPWIVQTPLYHTKWALIKCVHLIRTHLGWFTISYATRSSRKNYNLKTSPCNHLILPIVLPLISAVNHHSFTLQTHQKADHTLRSDFHEFKLVLWICFLWLIISVYNCIILHFTLINFVLKLVFFLNLTSSK